ncbi:DUF5677 domain-containing protein [Georgenia sp. Z1491]|uniref:DUF5677 domain-containing protein n=1 Tax=Georgenia sp. Z1491 TaxID=3416707 RepID=UPI003CFB01AA
MTEPEASSPIDIEAAANRATARLLDYVGNSDATDEAAARFSEDVKVEGRGLASEARERADAIGAAVERERTEHRAELARLWGRALDQYLAVAQLADETVSHVLERRQNQARSSSSVVDPRLQVVAALQARLSRVMTEVHALASDGLPRGALARARTGHEISVFATLLSEHGAPDGDHPDLIQRFVDHARVQAYQDANTYQTSGAGDLSDELVRKFRHASEQAVTDHGKDFKGIYGWAAVLFQPHRRLQFPDLEDLAGLRHTRSFYKWANHDVHATARSLELNTLVVGEDRVRYLTGRTLVGLAEPLSMALHSQLQVMTALLIGTGESENVVSLVTCTMLSEMVHNADDELVAASARADSTNDDLSTPSR